MAYTTIDLTINGATVKAIDVSGDGADVILEESLTDYDKEVMNAISDEAGATFADKMAAYTHVTGITGDVLYAKFVRDSVSYIALRESASADVSSLVAADAAQDTTIADHEARITALETP